jgi:hypothetical protein
LDVKVVSRDGEPFEAVAYVAGEKFIRPEGPPSPQYLAYIVTGAREHDLCEEYIRGIERLAKIPKFP